MVTLNTEVRIQNRSGVVVSTVLLSTFWSSLGVSVPFDPKLLYDPYGRRWIFTAAAEPRSANSALLLAASATSDPTGTWFMHKFDAEFDENHWADYPSIGFNRKWVVASVMGAEASGRFACLDRVFAFDKAGLYAGTPATATVFRTTCQPVMTPTATYDESLESMYLLGSSYLSTTAAGQGRQNLLFWTIAGEVGAETLTMSATLDTGEIWGGGSEKDFAPQLGASGRIQTNDDRIQNVVYRNGSLWAAHTVFLPGSPTRSSVQWWQLAPLGPYQVEIRQQGRIDDPTRRLFYAYPSIAVNKNNDVLIGYSRFSKEHFAGGYYAFRFASDPQNTLRVDGLLKAGESPYYKTFGSLKNRWGDYSATVVDPVNDQDMWTIQEYAAMPAGGQDRWATWWGRLAPVSSPAPTLTLSRRRLPLGNWEPGTTASGASILMNAGTAPLSIGSVILGGANPAAFSLSENCAGKTFAPGDGCGLGVSSLSPSQGARSARLLVASNTGGSPDEIDVSFVGGATTISISPPAACCTPPVSVLEFGDQEVGTTSPPQTVTVTNEGGTPLRVQQIQSIGPSTGEFPITDRCSGTTVSPGSNCTFDVVFAPRHPVCATWCISGSDRSNGGDTDQGTSFTVVGNVQTSVAGPWSVLARGRTDSSSLLPRPVSPVRRQFRGSFGSWRVGEDAPAPCFTPPGPNYNPFQTCVGSFEFVSNGSQPLSFGTAVIDGANPGDFRKVADTCSDSQVPLQSRCKIDVVFHPTTLGDRAARLVIPSDSPDSPYTIQLGGIGTDGIPQAAIAFIYENLPFAAGPVGGVTGGFGDVGANDQAFVFNVGSAPAQIGQISIGGAEAADFAITLLPPGLDTCSGSSLPAGGGCILSVGFAPTAGGLRLASLIVPSDAPEGTDSLPLIGIGTAATVTPANVEFGSVQVGDGATQYVTMGNLGEGRVSVESLQVAGVDARQFEVVDEYCSRTNVGLGFYERSCSVQVAFTPSSTGTFDATLRVLSNGGGSPQSVNLTGAGVASSNVDVSAETLAFGDRRVGTTSSPQTLTVSNTGNAPLNLGTVSIGGTNADQFAKSSDTCSGASIAPAEHCTLDVAFGPTSTGAKSASLSVPSDAPGSPHTVALDGTGIASALGLDPTSLSFGNQRVSTTSPTQTLTVSNTGDASLNLGTLSISGANADQFAKADDACSSASVAPGADCTLQVAFGPTSTGAKNANLEITSDAPGSPHTVALDGTGIASALGIDPTSLSFGNQRVSTTSPTQTLTVSNSSDASFNLGTITVAGTNADQFSKSSDTCSGASVPAGDGCTLQVAFGPTSTGAKNANLEITSDAPGSPHTVSLSGTGDMKGKPEMKLTPTKVKFRGTPVGATSNWKRVRVINKSSGPIEIGTISVGGIEPDEFDLESDNCSDATLEVSERCSIYISFSPGAPGERKATLTIPSDAADGPHNAALVGKGK